MVDGPRGGGLTDGDAGGGSSAKSSALGAMAWSLCVVTSELVLRDDACGSAAKRERCSWMQGRSGQTGVLGLKLRRGNNIRGH